MSHGSDAEHDLRLEELRSKPGTRRERCASVRDCPTDSDGIHVGVACKHDHGHEGRHGGGTAGWQWEWTDESAAQIALRPRLEKEEEPRWRKVKAARAWRAEAGEILEGLYLGQVAAEGDFGAYLKHLVHDGMDTWYATGARLNALMLASAVQPGARVKIVFLGRVTTSDGAREYKDFDLYVEG